MAVPITPKRRAIIMGRIAPDADLIYKEVDKILISHVKNWIVPLPIKVKNPYPRYSYYHAFKAEKLHALDKANTKRLWGKIEDRYFFTINSNVEHLIRGHAFKEIRVQLWFYEKSSNPRRSLVAKDMSTLHSDSNLRNLDAVNSICLLTKN